MIALATLGLLLAAVPLLGHLALAAWGTGRLRGAMATPPRHLPLRHRLPPLVHHLALATVAGLVALSALLLLLDLAGLPWRRGVLAVAIPPLAALLAAAAWRRRAAPAAPVAPLPVSVPLGWGDAGAALVLALFAAATWTRRTNIPDFIYHWGIKGKRYWLEGGIDFAFLTDPLGLTDHPDYPNLLPALYAVTAEALGRFRERAMLGWSVLFLVLVVAFARRALEAGLEVGPERPGKRSSVTRRHLVQRLVVQRLVVQRLVVQGGTLAVAMVAVMFAVGYQLAGGGDLLIALALLVALPGLLGGREGERGAVDGGDLRVGLAAALAAGAKIEGVPLGLLLIGVRWWKVGGVPGMPGWRAWRRRGAELLRQLLRQSLRRLPRLALPFLLVAGPWYVQCLRHGLFQDTNTGRFDPARWGEVAPAAWRVLTMPDWHGLPWLLALLPALLLVRRVRPAALVLCIQAGFYLFVYLTAPVDTEFYVLSSLPRLLYHLVVPAVVLVLVAGRTKS